MTQEQINEIKIIEEVLGVKFTGKTSAEANKFIKKYKDDVNDYLDALTNVDWEIA